VPSSDIPSLSDPAADWHKERTDGAPGDPEVSSGKGEWKRFLAFLSSKNRPMSKVLEEWELARLSKDVLELKKGNRSFSSAYFDDGEKLEQLRAYCGEFFGREVHISLLGDPNPAGHGKIFSPAKAKKNDKGSQKDFPPPVQDILDVFQGEITNGESPRKPVSD
jgi:hypothetical protein